MVNQYSSFRTNSFLNIVKPKSYFLVAAFIFFFFVLANAQDSSNRLQDLTINFINKGKISINGQAISYDSCKSILLSTPESSPEILEANKYEFRIKKISPIFFLPVFPAYGFGLADQVTHYQKPWITTTFICLAIPEIALGVYIHFNNKLKYRHFKKAIGIYNMTISKRHAAK